jgi:hypothetical protein
MEQFYVVENSKSLTCKSCGGVHQYFTNEWAFNCSIPQLMPEKTAAEVARMYEAKSIPIIEAF